MQKREEEQKDIWGILGKKIIKWVFTIVLGSITRGFELMKTVLYAEYEKKAWFLLFPVLFIIFLKISQTELISGNGGSNSANGIVFMLISWYYIITLIPIKLMKGESILPVFLGNSLNKEYSAVDGDDVEYYEWLKINKDKLDKLTKSIYEIFRINNLIIKGNTEEQNKYILMSGKPKLINLKSSEIEIKYILPNGLPFSKVDKDDIKQAILQVWQKYFPSIGSLDFSVKGDVMTIRSIRASGTADFSKTFSFPNLLNFSLMKTYENPLEFTIGVDEDGNIKKYDLAKMPHLLVASETGGGKSSAITNILASLMKNRVEGAPIDFTIIDPKKVEFALYRDLGGFRVETNYEKALILMAQLCEEMDNRYEELMNKGVKELKTLHNRGENLDMRYKVLIIDEFADIMTDPKVKNEFEMYIKRLTALGRACGIHIILATQNPTAEIVTGLIKANIPARLGLRTSDSTKSRIILDSGELATIKEKGEAYIKIATGIEHIKNFYISEDEIASFIEEYKEKNLIMNGEEKVEVEKDKYDFLFEKMKEEKTFKISWSKDFFKNHFSEFQFRDFSKIFQEEKILEKLPNNSLNLINENLLNDELKNKLKTI